MSPRKHYSTVDEYLADFTPDMQVLLNKVRKLMVDSVPEAEEVISYNIPCFKLGKTYMIYFAGYTKHISIYPVPRGSEKLDTEMKPYVKGKGTLQFQLSEKIPFGLIKKVVLQAKKNSLERIKAKKSGY